MAQRIPDIKEGYGRSARHTFTIGSGADGSAVDAIDLGRNYAFIVIECEDASGIDSATTLALAAGDEADATLLDVWASTGKWASPTLPTSGTFRLVVDEAAFAQLVRVVLSKVSIDDVVLYIYGFDPSIQTT